MDGRYRPILPQGSRPAASQHAPAATLPLPRINKQTRTACDVCRIKRAGCDGKKPCSRCVARGLTQDCIYRPRNASNTDIIKHLISLPEDEAVDLLRCLRATGNASRALATTNGAVHGTLRPSDHKMSAALSSPTGSSFEFELGVRHSDVYPKLPPLSAAWLATLVDQRADLLYEAPWHISHSPFPAPRDEADPSGSASATTRTVDASFAMPHSLLRQVGTAKALPTIGPVKKMQYCNPLLSQLDNIAYWTTVDISDEYAASLISLYLEKEHPVYGFFDAELFLRDLVQCRTRFCSSFLVNSILYYASYICVALDTRALTLVQLFGRETERIWDAEKGHESECILTLAASQVLATACLIAGKEALGQELAVFGRATARNMGLIGIPDDSLHVALLASPAEKRATSHTAWGTYCWFSLLSQYYRSPDEIKYPPTLPIPGCNCDISTGKDDAGGSLPECSHKTFPTICQFWAIVQEATSLFYKADRSGITLAELTPLHEIERVYLKLLSWARELDGGMRLHDSSPAHVIAFYMLFHTVVVNMFQPYLQLQPEDLARLESFSSEDATPESLSKASISQLKRLIWLYYYNGRGGPMSTFCNVGLTCASSAMLSNRHDSSWRTDLSLYVRLWTELNICYPIYTQIAQAFFSMAMEDGAISGAEARTIMDGITRAGRHHEANEVPTPALTYIADHAAAVKNPEDGRVDAIAERFGDLLMFDEWTTLSPRESNSGGIVDLPDGTQATGPDV